MKSTLPSVAVIIPTYNRATMLRRALESVLSQNYPNITKIVITDDGSTDNTKEIVEEYMLKDDRVVFIKNTKYRKGPAGNKNNGLDYIEYVVKPDLFCFLDDDWELFPGAISKLVNIYLEHEGRYDSVFGNAISETGEKITTVLKGLHEITYEDLICGRYRNDAFGVQKTSSLKGRRFFDDCWGGEWTLAAQIYKDGMKALYVDENFAKIYVSHADGVTKSMTSKADRQFLNYKYFLDIVEEDLKKICPRVLAKHCLSAAMLVKIAKKKSEVNFYLKKALSVSRRPKLVLIALIIVFSPAKLLASLRSSKLYEKVGKILWH